MEPIQRAPAAECDRQERRELFQPEGPACQTGGMSPPGSRAAFDSFSEIATVRIGLLEEEP
jgi:hypothetical protein